MRLWSLHPRYLDAKGLVALWREGLLAQKVLRGKTKGYKFHPQLKRFQAHARPLDAVGKYLTFVCDEAVKRGYRFDRKKIYSVRKKVPLIKVTRGQLAFEFLHLKKKLKRRDPKRYRDSEGLRKIKCHPVFRVIPGEIEPWEVV